MQDVRVQCAESNARMRELGARRSKNEAAQTWLSVQPTRVEELRGEVDVHITEKEQDVASLPEAGSDIQSLPPGKFSIQLDEGEVPETGSSRKWWEQKVRDCHSPPHHL